ncbi:MAG: cystathionine beta-synthase, partial [Pseudomonadota bacterium]
MSDYKDALKKTLENLPSDWLRLTTHRLDIYNEKLAKTEFLEKYEAISEKNSETLENLPTAFDYIRLGHPLSCVLEWALAKESSLNPNSVISFSSQTMPILAVLRKNKFLGKKTRIVIEESLPDSFDQDLLKSVYQYDFEVIAHQAGTPLAAFGGTTVFVGTGPHVGADIVVRLYSGRGSVIQVMDNDADLIKEIQHVRRRESIA